jgi:hypothetical protein
MEAVRQNGRLYGTGRGVYSRCVRCGRGGARCFYGGKVHKACLDADERKDYEKKLLASFTAKTPADQAEANPHE